MKMYIQPTTEAFDLKGENLMQGLTNPVSSGGNASDKQDQIFDGD